MKPKVFWTDQFSPETPLPVSMVLPADVDVAIVGSGYTGLTAARVLAKAGSSVVVMDQYEIGWGASSRNGGMATPGLKQDIFKIHEKYGMDYAREFWRSSVDAIDLLEQIIIEEKIACDWSRKGHIALSCKQSHYDELEEYAAWIKREMAVSYTHLRAHET